MTTQQQNNDDPDYVRIPREQIRKLENAAKRAEQAERRAALLEAGVDLSTPLGKLFAKAYDGKVDDLDAIKAAATEVGALRVAAPEQKTETEPEAKGEETQQSTSSQEDNDGSTDERGRLSTGASADDKVTEHPSVVARKAAQHVVEEGGAYEDAVSAAWQAKIDALLTKGDKRVLWEP